MGIDQSSQMTLVGMEVLITTDVASPENGHMRARVSG